MSLPRSGRILIVDDDPFTCDLLGHMLARLGYTDVLTHSEARSAAESLGVPDAGVDLILLDLNMPDIDGIEFLRQLAKLNYGGGVVLVSGEDEQVLQSADALVQQYRIRSLGHLRKPVHPELLKSLLEAWQPAAVPGPERTPSNYTAADIRRAISRQEFVTMYQPKVAVADGALVGVESLVRWRHPEDGMVFPDQFIGVAETHGLIQGLTRLVLSQSLRQARAWRNEGMALHVAVNVSTDCLGSLDFPDAIDAEARAVGVPAQDVVLEITESRLMPRIAAVLDVLTRLRLRRFRLSIDDFGTGHSSLAQLRDVPFGEIKVDRGFIHGASRHEKCLAICETSCELARQLGIGIVAEGVEDRDDWEMVRRLGFNVAQGYFIGRPMPGIALAPWLERWKKHVAGMATAGRPRSGGS